MMTSIVISTALLAVLQLVGLYLEISVLVYGAMVLGVLLGLALFFLIFEGVL